MTARLISILILLAGATAPAAAQTADKYKDIHTVCIVSQMGDTLALSHTGGSLLGNSAKTVQVGDWKLDDFAAQIMVSELSPHFTIPPAQAAGIRGCTGMQILPANTVDAYVILGKTAMQDPYAPGTKITGLGLLSRSILIGSPVNYVYAMTFASVINARTGVVMDYGIAAIPSGVRLKDPGPPWSPLENISWPEAPNPPAPDVLAKANTAIRNLLQQSVPHALQNAGLY